MPDSHSKSSEKFEGEFFVVGVGASAGGLSALEEFFARLSPQTGAAYVVIQHLSPDFKSLMKELLERQTSMPVYRVTEGMKLESNSVYLIPPGQNLALENNVLRLAKRPTDENNKPELNFPIDLFFTSLADNFGDQAIGVVLSGSGSDGTVGLKAISEVGGVTLVQTPETAEFDGMPISAISTGVVNQISPPQELALLIEQYITNPLPATESASSSINPSYLRRIAKLLIEEEGLDFSEYKPNTISRRVHRRCSICGFRSVDDYVRFLSNSEQERKILCGDLLINVTHFFRNAAAWQILERQILPQLIAKSEPETELRFWITACSTGEEAYSLAILVYEALASASKNLRVKIFATDIDRVALQKASQGIYSAAIARQVGSTRLAKYFVFRDNAYQIIRKIREMLIFSPHDLTKDAGFTKINLVTCRNVLIYMKPSLQDRVFRNLHFALVNQGILFLGEAETLGSLESEFNPLNKKWNFLEKRRDVRLPVNLSSSPRISSNLAPPYVKPIPKTYYEPILEQCLNRLTKASGSIILLVGKNNNLIHVSGDSSKIFKAPDGKITTEVNKMVVTPLGLPLTTALHRARQTKQSVRYQEIKLEHQSEILHAVLEVLPPPEDSRQGDFAMVKIELHSVNLPEEIVSAQNFEVDQETSQQIFELESELLQTRETLQTLVEELESTNEEQQASNEELTASNEELQSTNEELHSVNEELHTVNIEYQSKIQELTELNDDIDNLLKSTEIGVIFLDAQLRIRKFTPAVATAITLRPSDLERPLIELYWKFECPNLLKLLEQVLVTNQPQEAEVKLKQSPGYLLMQINPYHTEGGQSEGLVISFIKIDEIKQVQQRLEAEVIARQASEANLLVTKQRVESIFSSLEDAVWSFDLVSEQIIYVNDSFEKIYGRNPDELTACALLWLEMVHPDERDFVREAHQLIQPGENLDLKYRIVHGDRASQKHPSCRWVRDRSRTIYEQGVAIRQDFIISDITAQIEAQQALKSKEQSFQAIFNSMFQFIGVLSPQGILLEANETALAFGGLKLEDVINRPFWEAKWWTINAATQQQLKDAIATAARGEFIRYEVDVLGAENHVTTIDFSIKPVTDETGNVVQLIPEGRDISELKQAREKLQQTNQELEQRVAMRTRTLAQFGDRLQELHRLSINHYKRIEDLYTDYLEAGCQMLALDTGIIGKTDDSTYQIVAVNSALNLAVGDQIVSTDIYSSQVIATQKTVTYVEVGKIDAMQQHPAYLKHRLEAFIGTPIFVNGSFYGTLNFADLAPKKPKFSDEEIKIVELMAKDIGNSIASIFAEAAIQQSEIRFRNTFEQAAVGVAHVSPAGKFIKVNQRLCNILGYDNQALLNKTFQEITHPEDLDRDLKYVQQILNGNIGNYSLEQRYIKRDQSIIWLNLTVSLVKNRWSEPDYLIAVIEDISDRKKTEFALEQSRLRLKEANQAKDNFIAHMSHELRTPLNSVIGFSQILKQDSSLTAEQLKSINIVNQSGQHLLTLINDVLVLSKVSANKLQLKYRDLNLLNFLHEISAIFQIRAQTKGLNFNIETAADLPLVISTDETRLRQVLFNLLSNALKFTEVGTVTLSVSSLSTISADISRLRFQVEDTGCGIPPAEFAHVFAAFGQIDSSSGDLEGTGLGIPICQNILQLMDSELHLGSKVGEGSYFWFDLDLATASDPNLPALTFAQPIQNRVLATPCKVLVVDDNADNRFLLIHYLQAMGFVLAEADNGKTGLETALEFQPDVILVDLLMPIVDGREMIERIAQYSQFEDTVMVMISANLQSIINSAQIKCDGFLAKPINLAKLLELLEQHLKLDWQTVTPSTSTISTPTPAQDWLVPATEQLNELLQLTNFGKMQAVLKEAELLLSENSDYIHFVEQVRQLAEGCQQSKLEAMIEKLIADS